MRLSVFVVVIALLVGLSACGGASTSEQPATPPVKQPSSVTTDKQSQDTGLSKAERRYLEDTGDTSGLMYEALNTVSTELSVWPDSDVSRLATGLTVMQTSYDQWSTRRAPSTRLSKLHRLWVGCLRDFHNCAGNIAKGIDTMDIACLEKAMSQMEAGTDKLSRCTTEVERIEESL